MAKLFEIYEDDLAELERILPALGEAMMPHLTNPLRVQLRRCQSILSNIRWNYGPPSEVKVISCRDDADEGEYQTL